MVEEKKTEKFQELVDRVHSGLDLLSDDDLNVLFEEAEKTPSNDQATPTAASTPQPAPTSAEPAPPVGEPPKGQANPMSLVPEKFRGKDEAETLTRMAKATADLEAELTREKQERSQLQSMVQTLSQKRELPTSVTEPIRAEPGQVDEDIDDAIFFESPTVASKKIAEKVAKEIFAAGVREYDSYTVRREALTKFKETHSDFDNYQTEVYEVCKAHPEWDNDLGALPKIYEAAKAKAIEKAKNFNLQPAIDVDALTAKIKSEVEASAFEKAKLAIIEEIKKRKAAAGIMSSGQPQSPSDRLTSQPKTEPLTEDERLFDDMVKSGPKSLNLGS